MYPEILSSPSFLKSLPQMDAEIRDNTRKKNCPHCAGKLDVSNYKRKTRGVAPEYIADLELRLSLCCRVDGCRKRVQPASVIFFGRRCWLACFFVVASVLAGGSPEAKERFLQETQLSPRQLQRWRRWWNEVFVRSSVFRKVEAFFPANDSHDDLMDLPDWICNRLNFKAPDFLECNFFKFLKLIEGAKA